MLTPVPPTAIVGAEAGTGVEVEGVAGVCDEEVDSGPR